MVEATFLGNLVDYQIEAAGLTLRVQRPAGEQFEVGEAVLIEPTAPGVVVE